MLGLIAQAAHPAHSGKRWLGLHPRHGPRGWMRLHAQLELRDAIAVMGQAQELLAWH